MFDSLLFKLEKAQRDMELAEVLLLSRDTTCSIKNRSECYNLYSFWNFDNIVTMSKQQVEPHDLICVGCCLVEGGAPQGGAIITAVPQLTKAIYLQPADLRT